MRTLGNIFAKTVDKSGNTHQSTKGRVPAKAGYRRDCNIYFKSSMEANFYRCIKYLIDKHGHITDIYYEPHLYMYPKNNYNISGYTPDFELKNKLGHKWYVETKGYMDVDSWAKIVLFRKLYPDKMLIVYDGSSMIKIKRDYGRYIPNWE